MASGHRFHVLFVCLGNACRSPMAESIARQLASDVLEPSSAGLYPLGRLPEPTEQTLIANGYSIKGLSSKPLRRAALEASDLVINMTGAPLEGLFAGYVIEDVPLAERIETWTIEDPYGADPATYQRILEELESKIMLLAGRLRDTQRATSS
jgi:protein-tyrosine phosphatase